MKTYKLVIGLLAAAMLLFQGPAFAEIIQGVIAALDPAAHSLTLTRQHPETGIEESLQITVTPDATYSGILSLEELKTGNTVRVDAAPDEAGMLKAKSVEIVPAAAVSQV